ncbi:hypothetical protein NQ318_023387, partial [Aromia moschata]
MQLPTIDTINKYLRKLKPSYGFCEKTFCEEKLSQRKGETPDGLVKKKKHWRALLEFDGEKDFRLKCAFKLTSAHLDPKYYQKMNVSMAAD